MKSKNLFILQLIVFTIIFSGTELVASTPRVVSLTTSACKYDVTIPEGWDTIPKTVLKEKLKQYNADLGIYPVAQKEYFNGNYAFFVFLPTIKSLNSLKFGQIVAEIKNQNQQGEIQNDTLRIRFIKMDPEKENENYSIYSYFQIRKDSILLENCQMLRLTKFGYISVLSYEKKMEEAIMPIEKVVTLLSGSISIQPDYKYSEPQEKGLNLKSILISLAIGILVYGLITGVSKLKKKR